MKFNLKYVLFGLLLGIIFLACGCMETNRCGGFPLIVPDGTKVLLIKGADGNAYSFDFTNRRAIPILDMDKKHLKLDDN
jgi:hypothetical protein